MTEAVTAQTGATITVTLGAKSAVIPLDGEELSSTTQPDGRVHRYLSNASKDFITSKIEAALLTVTEQGA